MAGKRVAYFDLLNILAIFGVIVLHCSELVFSFQPSLRWSTAATLQILFIWSVPIFFMISGANLLDYRQRYTTKVFLKKRALRVVIPFLFWSIIWYLRNIIMDKQVFSITELLKGIIWM